MTALPPGTLTATAADRFESGSSDLGLVHDYLLVLRGAERTFAAIADLWPAAPVYTLLYDHDGTAGRFAGHPIRTSRLQATGVRQHGFRRLLPLFPAAVERLPVRRHRVVVSSSSAFAHGVRPAPGAVHVCYCHSPFRYAHFERRRAMAEVPRPLRPAVAATLAGVRRWDVNAARRVTRYVANSRHTQARIRRLYGVGAEVVHPPVEVGRFRSGEPEDYFLTVCELVAHKRVEVAAAAATAAGARLKVVGTGPELPRLQAQFGRSVQFLGRVDDPGLERLYAHARAVVVPNVEEFGIAAVEAQAAGRPVLAARAGGALETVVDGRTGRFFEPDDVAAATQLMRGLNTDDFDPDEIVRHAHHFSPEAFRARMQEQVSDAVRRA
ncbi:MAG: glycosyltransferase [Solirubrobacteraceae bacterium]